MAREKGIIGLFMSFLMIASVFAVPMGFANSGAKPTNNNNNVNRARAPILNNSSLNNSTNMTLNNTTTNNTTTQRQERNRYRFRKNEPEHESQHGQYGPVQEMGHGSHSRSMHEHHVSMRHVRGKLMQFRERVEHLLHKRRMITEIHKAIKYELMPLMHRVRLDRKKAIELKMELVKECGTNVSNYSKCNVSLVDEYLNTTKVYLLNALMELKIKLEIMKAITNDTTTDALITNITALAQKIEAAKNITALEALKPELEEVVHEARIRLAEDALLMKFAVLSLFVDRSITMVKNLETRINNTTIDTELQKVESSLLQLQTEITNITSSNLTTSYKNLSKEFVTLKTKYIETMKELRELLIEYMKTRRMH